MKLAKGGNQQQGLACLPGMGREQSIHGDASVPGLHGPSPGSSCRPHPGAGTDGDRSGEQERGESDFKDWKPDLPPEALSSLSPPAVKLFVVRQVTQECWARRAWAVVGAKASQVPFQQDNDEARQELQGRIQIYFGSCLCARG